ncbi:MAG: hypothetical protein RL479_244 [Verrucomicrobiota bacterium]
MAPIFAKPKGAVGRARHPEGVIQDCDRSQATIAGEAADAGASEVFHGPFGAAGQRQDRQQEEKEGETHPDEAQAGAGTATIALITRVSGRVQDGKTAGNPAKSEV